MARLRKVPRRGLVGIVVKGKEKKGTTKGKKASSKQT